jgi:hypothetical protein
VNLLDRLIDTYLLNDMDDAYYDVKEKAIVYDWDDDETAESEIDWDDEENCERYELIPTISTFESFRLMEQFVDSVDDDRKRNMLFQALRKSKPFRRFKDTLLELGIRDEWFALEYQYGKEQIEEWLEGLQNE